MAGHTAQGVSLFRGPSKNGCGSKLNQQGTADFGPWFHLPGFHVGYLLLTPAKWWFALVSPAWQDWELRAFHQKVIIAASSCSKAASFGLMYASLFSLLSSATVTNRRRTSVNDYMLVLEGHHSNKQRSNPQVTNSSLPLKSRPCDPTLPSLQVRSECLRTNKKAASTSDPFKSKEIPANFHQGPC